MSIPNREPPTADRVSGKQSGLRLIKLIPFLFIIVFATLFLRDQFPQVDDFLRSVVSPEQHQAITNCRQRALLQSDQPDFARLVKGGKITATQNGYLIDHLVIGEMESNGGEKLFDISCHSRTNGEIVQVHRKPLASTVRPVQLEQASDN